MASASGTKTENFKTICAKDNMSLKKNNDMNLFSLEYMYENPNFEITSLLNVNLYNLLFQVNQDIIDKVCRYFDFTFEILQDKTKKGEIVFARQICQWFLMKKCGLTCTHVAGLFLRDHTSILHSIKMVNNMLEADYDNPTKYHVDQLKAII